MLMFQKGRRAQIESHFSWVFVLIAGAVIIAFFFSVVQKQRDFSQQKLALTLAYDFEAVLGSAAVAKGASQPLSLYGQEIQFSCSESCACGMSVGDFQRPFREKIIFSQSKINGKNMLLWTLDWKNPFRVANFVYATDDNTYYWFVNGTATPPDIANYLYKNFTKLAKYEFVQNLNAISNKGFKKNRVVMINFAPPSSFPSNVANLQGISALKVTGSLDSGDLTFYSLNSLSTTKTNSYTSTEHLLGAIFSEDPNMYDCGLKSSQTRFEVIKETYLARASKLKDEDWGTRECFIKYDEAENELEKAAFNTGALESINNALMLASCPTIY
jgi:hypothetical protein